MVMAPLFRLRCSWVDDRRSDLVLVPEAYDNGLLAPSVACQGVVVCRWAYRLNVGLGDIIQMLARAAVDRWWSFGFTSFSSSGIWGIRVTPLRAGRVQVSTRGARQRNTGKDGLTIHMPPAIFFANACFGTGGLSM